MEEKKFACPHCRLAVPFSFLQWDPGDRKIKCLKCLGGNNMYPVARVS